MTSAELFPKDSPGKCVPELFPTPVHSQLRYDDLKLRQFCVWESSLLLLEVITLS